MKREILIRGAICVCLIGQHHAYGVRMHHAHASIHTSELPARITILMLRAALKAGIPPNRIVLEPAGFVLTDDEAARVLAQTPGARCSAIVRGDAIWVRCEPLAGSELDRERRFERALGGYIGTLGYETLRESGLNNILIVGDAEQIIASANEIEAASKNYFIDMDRFSLGGRYPTPEQRAAGIGWVVRVGRTYPVPPEEAAKHFPPEVQRAMLDGDV